MRTLIVAALLAAGPAAAETAIFRSDAVTVRLTQNACDGMAAQLLGEEQAKQMKRAYITFDKRDFTGCWMLRGEEVLIVDDEGDAGVIPAKDFKPDGV